MQLDRRLLRQIQLAPALLILTIIFGLAVGVLAIFQAKLIVQVIHAVFLIGMDVQGVKPLMLLLLVVIAARAMLLLLNEACAGMFAVRVKNALRSALTQKLLRAGPASIQGEQAGEIGALILEGIEALDAYFSQFLPQLVLACLLPAAILIFVFPLDFISGLVLLITAPLIPVFMFLIGSTSERLTRRQWTTLSRLSAYFLETLRGLTTLKTLNKSRKHGQSIERVSEQYRQITMQVLRVTFLSALVLELVGAISTAMIAVEVGLRLLYGRLYFDQALFILMIAPDFYLPLRNLGLRFHAAMGGVSSAKRIFNFLDLPESETTGGENASDGAVEPGEPLSVSFEEVSYSYPGRNEMAVREASFVLPAGKLTALVGSSGAGKSTLANLLLRFINPQAGKIRVNGLPLEKIPLATWRKMITWVPQHPMIFSGTVLDNLRLGSPQASLDDVHLSVKSARLDEWVERLPQRYLTILGEGGVNISGGQAQRLAIARALLTSAPILVMDEPSSALDPELENQLASAIKEISRKRTVLMIAHRLATVEFADHILVLDEGRIVESGTHGQLMERNQKYAHLMQRFVEDR